MEKEPSPLDTLRQLKEWLDAGTITPNEFQTLKQQLLFPESMAAAALTPAPVVSPAPVIMPEPRVTTPENSLPEPLVFAPETIASEPMVVEPEISAQAPLVVTSDIIAPEPPAAIPEIWVPERPVIAPEIIASALSETVPEITAPDSMDVPVIPAEAAPPIPPVLPPITAPVSVVVPEPPLPPAPEPIPEPTTVAPVEMLPMLPPITHTAATNSNNEKEYVEPDAYTAPRKSPLMTIVVVAAVLALLGLVAYLLMDGRDSEHLTSTSRTEADSVAVQPEVGPQTEQIDLPPVIVPETIRVAPVAPPVVIPTSVDTAVMMSATTVPVDASISPAAPAPGAPVVSESAARARVEGVIQRYYTDLQAAPFTASAYFAPQVERFYTMQSTTPAAINAELAKTHFPEFLEGQSTIQAGTLQVGAPVADGSRVVTYVEDSKAFRQSRQELQRTSAQMRIRFDKDFKIVYLRQEKLLKNEFGD